MDIRNPNPQMPSFLAPIMNIYDMAAGAGIWLSAVAVVIIAIMLVFIKVFGGRMAQIVGGLVCVIAAGVLILNAGTFVGAFS